MNPGQVFSNKECIALVFLVCRKLSVRAQMVTTKLLSEEDKEDMRKGMLTGQELEAHIRVWVENGMPNYTGFRSPKNDAYLAVLESSVKWEYCRPFIIGNDVDVLLLKPLGQPKR